MFDIGEPALGAIASFVGPCGFSTCFANCLKRPQRGLIGGGKVRFSLRQPVGGASACRS